MKSKPFLLITVLCVFCLILGTSYILGFKTLSVTSDLSCMSICGLTLLFSHFFGLQIGNYIVGLIWSVIGLSLFAFAYRFSR
ncbi:hypothetical protein D791_01719 [Nitrincola nitratireducens]|uniref:Uncharacterized protein n=1 Tax=Nitrincola nitratireducens TaxID=1229521 RepID=W9UW03_9GAMM|nr:hypothetical protein D791_01719 [Nitrincola nitratireducens]